MIETDAMVSSGPPMMLVGTGEAEQRMERSAVHAVVASTLAILIEEIALAIRMGKITEPAQVLVVLSRVRKHYAPAA